MRVAAILLLGCGLATAAEVPLRAGLARVDITPSAFGPMYGYRNRKCGPANGTHDPLMAKVLLLATGEARVAIVTLDLGTMFSERLRGEVASKLKIPVLLLAASHTHSGPQFLPYGPEAAAPSPYLAELEAKIFKAVKEASENTFPARLSVGRGSLQLGYNRLVLSDTGRVRTMFENPDRVPYGEVDPEFQLLRVEDEGGSTRALVVHYACHAVVLGPTNCKYSADYPGVMQARVEERLKGVQCMFVQGAAGDINPLAMARSGKEDDDFLVVRKMGEALAAEVLRAARRIPPGAPNRDIIRYATRTLRFQDRWEAGKSLEFGITTVLLNREIAIAATPGETLHRLQKQWKTQADVPHALFYGYTWSAVDRWPGYIPDIRSAAYGGYGADRNTTIEVGAGERIVQQHLIQLYQLLGMWQDKPGTQ